MKVMVTTLRSSAEPVVVGPRSRRHGGRVRCPRWSGSTGCVDAALGAGSGLVAAYRRTGADVPFGDPVPSHGAEMEGWFWRVTDPATGRVVVALCGVNRHPAGDWATVAVALHPGGIVRSAALDDARADRTRLRPARRHGGGGHDSRRPADRLRVDLDDVHLDLRFTESFEWPKAFGGGGVFSAVPFLNQYWQPVPPGRRRLRWRHLRRQRIRGRALVARRRDRVYGERNWGAGFPDRWWWGQAHDFDGADVSVAFSGGVLRLGPIARPVCGVVVRLGDRVIRITPPAPVHSDVTAGRWTVRARSWRYQDRPGRGRHRHRTARAAGAAAGRATQRRHRLRAPGRSAPLRGARARPGGVRRHLRAGRPRGGEPAGP